MTALGDRLVTVANVGHRATDGPDEGRENSMTLYTHSFALNVGFTSYKGADVQKGPEQFPYPFCNKPNECFTWHNYIPPPLPVYIPIKKNSTSYNGESCTFWRHPIQVIPVTALYVASATIQALAAQGPQCHGPKISGWSSSHLPAPSWSYDPRIPAEASPRLAKTAPTVWNKLPHAVQKADSRPILKKALKAYLFSCGVPWTWVLTCTWVWRSIDQRCNVTAWSVSSFSSLPPRSILPSQTVAARMQRKEHTKDKDLLPTSN